MSSVLEELIHNTQWNTRAFNVKKYSIGQNIMISECLEPFSCTLKGKKIFGAIAWRELYVFASNPHLTSLFAIRDKNDDILMDRMTTQTRRIDCANKMCMHEEFQSRPAHFSLFMSLKESSYGSLWTERPENKVSSGPENPQSTKTRDLKPLCFQKNHCRKVG